MESFFRFWSNAVKYITDSLGCWCLQRNVLGPHNLIWRPSKAKKQPYPDMSTEIQSNDSGPTFLYSQIVPEQWLLRLPPIIWLETCLSQSWGAHHIKRKLTDVMYYLSQFSMLTHRFNLIFLSCCWPAVPCANSHLDCLDLYSQDMLLTSFCSLLLSSKR